MHIPKCAGQSIEMAFLKDLGLTWEDRSSLLLMKNKNPRNGPPFLSHLTYSEYTRYGYLTEKEMHSSHVFAVVRNPFKRIESFYRFLGYDCAVTFDYFVNHVVPKKLRSNHRCHYFFRPQIDYLKDGQGHMAVDKCLKLEDKDTLVQHLKSLGIHELPHVNKSVKRGWFRRALVRLKFLIQGHYDWRFVHGRKIQWTTDLASKITALYSEDFSILNYDLVPEFSLACHPLTIEQAPLQPSTIAVYSENEESFSE